MYMDRDSNSYLELHDVCRERAARAHQQAQRVHRRAHDGQVAPHLERRVAQVVGESRELGGVLPELCCVVLCV